MWLLEILNSMCGLALVAHVICLSANVSLRAGFQTSLNTELSVQEDWGLRGVEHVSPGRSFSLSPKSKLWACGGARWQVWDPPSRGTEVSAGSCTECTPSKTVLSSEVPTPAPLVLKGSGASTVGSNPSSAIN